LELTLLFIVVVLILIGSILGWTAFFKSRNLNQEVQSLRRQVKVIKSEIHELKTFSEKPAQKAVVEPDPKIVSEPVPDIHAPETHAPETHIPETIDPEIAATETTVPVSIEDEQFAPETYPEDEKKPKITPSPWETYPTTTAPPAFIVSFKQNWMTWLGGFCIALAGIMLARYAIQKGIFGPTARVISGIVTGLALHLSAEWLRRRTKENHLVFAMLAAGGSITLFATLLASLHLYQMISPMVVFIILAIVATATMWLALIYGPALAAMGMLGAYVVPILVSTGSGQILGAMLYSLLISTSILFLMRYVYRYWLWFGLLAGGYLWWALSLTYSSADGWRGLYLAMFAYGLIAIVPRDWMLQKIQAFNSPADTPLNIYLMKGNKQEHLLPVSILLIVIAQCLTIFIEHDVFPSLLNLTPLAIVVLLASNKKQNLTSLPWALYLGQLICLLAINVSHDKVFLIKEIAVQYQVDYFLFLSSTSILFSAFAIRNFNSSQFKTWWSSLAILAPLFAIIVSYLLGSSYIDDWLWSLNAIVFGAAYFYLATRANHQHWNKAWTVWLFLAGHFAYTFAAVILLENAGLTLALAIQAISVAAVIKRFDVPEIGWLIKIVVLLVVARLTVNPWLVDYPATMHWTLWTYGGATLCCYFAGRMLADTPKLARWTEAGALHLFVLTLWIETRYWLYDGIVFIEDFTLIEAAINVSLFGTLALVYEYKTQFSDTLKWLYKIYSILLMILAQVSYGIIIVNTIFSNSWVWKHISETLFFNLLLLAYFMPIIIAYLSYKYFNQRYKKYFIALMAFASFVFINLEIRHIWTGNINLIPSASNGEMYTYSAVWMILAITAILAGSWRFGKTCYRSGMILLAMVIFKVFIVDMYQLEGIYRIVAFMGLGLSLLGIAYLHKRIGTAVFTDDDV